MRFKFSEWSKVTESSIWRKSCIWRTLRIWQHKHKKLFISASERARAILSIFLDHDTLYTCNSWHLYMFRLNFLKFPKTIIFGSFLSFFWTYRSSWYGLTPKNVYIGFFSLNLITGFFALKLTGIIALKLTRDFAHNLRAKNPIFKLRVQNPGNNLREKFLKLPKLKKLQKDD